MLCNALEINGLNGLNSPDSKSDVGESSLRGFKSHPLRHLKAGCSKTERIRSMLALWNRPVKIIGIRVTEFTRECIGLLSSPAAC